MSSKGLTFTGAPQIEVNASDAEVGRAVAPRTNAALQLAGALSDLNPKLQQLGAQYVAEDQAVQGAAAKKKAIETGGKELATAVRDGTILPTQNPFFIQHYNEESAYVRSQAALSQLAIDSQQWAEKNDHQAFAARYHEEVAKIGEGFAGDQDTATGFNAAAAPAMQQALAANTAQVAANIEKDRQAALSQLVVDGIVNTQKNFAGKASPQQLNDALTPTKDRYLSTGGTESEWSKLVYQGFTSAAYNTSDPDLLDKLPDSIKKLPGISDQLANDKYRIMQDKGAATRIAAEDVRNKITLQGQQVFTAAYKKYGLGLIQGSVSFAQLAADNPGVDPLSIAAAVNTVQATTADNQSLDIARTRSFENSPGGSTYLLDLNTEAATVGISPELNAKIGALVHDKQISAADGSQIINRAIETTKGLNQQPGAIFPTPAKGLKVAQGATAASIQPYDDLRKSTDAEVQQWVAWINPSLRVGGNPAITPSLVGYLQARLANASAQWLALHPGDFPGARHAAQASLGDWTSRNIDGLLKPKQKGSSK